MLLQCCEVAAKHCSIISVTHSTTSTCNQCLCIEHRGLPHNVRLQSQLPKVLLNPSSQSTLHSYGNPVFFVLQGHQSGGSLADSPERSSHLRSRTAGSGDAAVSRDLGLKIHTDAAGLHETVARMESLSGGFSLSAQGDANSSTPAAAPQSSANGKLSGGGSSSCEDISSAKASATDTAAQPSGAQGRPGDTLHPAGGTEVVESSLRSTSSGDGSHADSVPQPSPDMTPSDIRHLPSETVAPESSLSSSSSSNNNGREADGAPQPSLHGTSERVQQTAAGPAPVESSLGSGADGAPQSSLPDTFASVEQPASGTIAVENGLCSGNGSDSVANRVPQSSPHGTSDGISHTAAEPTSVESSNGSGAETASQSSPHGTSDGDQQPASGTIAAENRLGSSNNGSDSGANGAPQSSPHGASDGVQQTATGQQPVEYSPGSGSGADRGLKSSAHGTSDGVQQSAAEAVPVDSSPDKADGANGASQPPLSFTTNGVPGSTKQHAPLAGTSSRSNSSGSYGAAQPLQRDGSCAVASGGAASGGSASGGVAGGGVTFDSTSQPLRKVGSSIGSPLGSPINKSSTLAREKSLHKMYGQQVEVSSLATRP